MALMTLYKGGEIMSNFSRKLIELNPITKLFAILSLGISTLVSPNLWFGFICLFFLIIISVIIQLFKPFCKLIFGFGIPLTLMLVFIQGFYSPKNETILFDFGFLELGLEGTVYALKLVSILLVFMGTIYLTNQTTPTSRLVATLVESGLSPKAGYLILASLNVVPQMNHRMKIIKEAQESRGVDTAGNIISRIKSFIPLIGPVVLSSFTDAQERGMTLEIRGFSVKGVKPTSIIEIQKNFSDQVVRILLLILLVSTIIYKFL